jgi:hypothetical protein
MDFMERIAAATKRSPFVRLSQGLLSMFLVATLAGCGAGNQNTSASTQQAAPQTYLAPYISGGAIGINSPPTAYTIDDTAQTFSVATFLVNGHAQNGSQVYFAGSMATTPPLARGLLSPGTTYSYTYPNGTTYSTPEAGWGIEMAGQSGGLVALYGQPATPLVPAETCPNYTTPQTFQFLTLPGAFISSGTAQHAWNSNIETAYGSADISSSGTTVTFDNIKQYTLPATVGGASGTPANPAVSPVTGVCSSTFYGNTVSVPSELIVTDPGSSQTVPAQSIIGIGPSGLLVESNTPGASGSSGASQLYQNVLGAGTGAIGLPKPSSAVDTSALVAAQYLGFFYGSGSYGGSGGSNGCGSGSNGPSTCVASFGFATQPSNCKSVATQTSTMIYGGDFPSNNPGSASMQKNGGYSTRCDIAVDLGTEDPNNNGLYPAAKIYVGTAYAGNTAGVKYSFPAVAIAGQLNGKYAIFVLGADTTGTPNQAWMIYLTQSN